LILLSYGKKYPLKSKAGIEDIAQHASCTQGGGTSKIAFLGKQLLTHFQPQLDKLVISQLGLLAQRRLARGVKLNHSEACVCFPIPEIARSLILTIPGFDR
jgi:Urease, gamma subunit